MLRVPHSPETSCSACFNQCTVFLELGPLCDMGGLDPTPCSLLTVLLTVLVGVVSGRGDLGKCLLGKACCCYRGAESHGNCAGKVEVPQCWAGVGQGHSLSTGCWAAECAELRTGLCHVLGCLKQVLCLIYLLQKYKETELYKVLPEGGVSAYPKISCEVNLISNTGSSQSTVLRKHTFPLTECKLVNSFQQPKMY